jgi:hypothetical protein
LWLRRPAESTEPSGESFASLSSVSGETPWRWYTVTTCSSSVGGTILRSRSEIERSMMRATAMTEASSSGQMGQPAA